MVKYAQTSAKLRFAFRRAIVFDHYCPVEPCSFLQPCFAANQNNGKPPALPGGIQLNGIVAKNNVRLAMKSALWEVGRQYGAKIKNGAEFNQLRFVSLSTHCCNRNLPVAYFRPKLCF